MSERAWPWIVAIVAALLFANTLFHEFAIDDAFIIEQNPEIRSLGSLPSHFVRPYWPQRVEAGLFRPLTVASFTLNRALTGSGPTGFHAVNVLLHALASFLAWHCARRITGTTLEATIAALLFALHPLHSDAVANVTGRSEVLGAVGVLAAWLLHRRARDGDAGRGVSIAAASCYLLALLSKESMVLAPLVFLVDDRLQGRDRAVRGASIYAAYGAAIAVMLVLRTVALGGIRGAEDVHFIDDPLAFASQGVRLGTALWVQVKYLLLFLWPARLSFDYSFESVPLVESALDLRLWAGLAWVVALVAAFAYGLRRWHALALGVAIWVAFLLPSSNLLFISGVTLAERLAYLSVLGGCLVAGWLAALLVGDGASRRTMVLGAVAVVALSLSVRTLARNAQYHDNFTLTQHDARALPGCAKLQATAASQLDDRGDDAGAEAGYRRALEIYPDYPVIRNRLGKLLLRTGRTEAALEQLRLARDELPDQFFSYDALAPVLELAGHREEALEVYAAGSEIAGDNFGFRFNHGRLLRVMNRRDEARTVLEKLARDDPEGIPGGLARAMAHEIRGEDVQAAAEYSSMLARDDLPDGVRANIEGQLAALRGGSPPGEPQ